MKVLTPEQLEDAAITDAINTIANLESREHKRRAVNRLRSVVGPQVDRARQDGRRVDVHTLVQRLWKQTNANRPD